MSSIEEIADTMVQQLEQQSIPGKEVLVLDKKIKGNDTTYDITLTWIEGTPEQILGILFDTPDERES